MIKREYSKILEKELKFKEITLLIGSRQVGKTTLIKELFEKVKKKSIYISFDDIEILNLFEENEKLFKEQFVNPYEIIFIDEFQYSKKGGKVLKYLFDSTGKKFFITGSSIPELTIQSISCLVGRIRTLEIYPISFKEYVNYLNSNLSILLEKNRKINEFSQIENLFGSYLKFGGYPQIVTLNLKEKEKQLKTLVNTYLLKEIKEVLEYKNVFESEKLLKYLALNDGGLLNKSNICGELEISKNALNQMLSMFEKTYILNILKPYLKNKSKEEVKSPKIYFQDLGFKNSLIKNFNELSLRNDKGKIYENFILNFLKRAEFEVFFYNYKNRYEMDFVIEKNQEVFGFEIKSKLKNDKLTNSTKKFVEKFSPKKVFVVNENLDKKIIYLETQVEFISFFNLIVKVNLEKLV